MTASLIQYSERPIFTRLRSHMFADGARSGQGLSRCAHRRCQTQPSVTGVVWVESRPENLVSSLIKNTSLMLSGNPYIRKTV